MLKILKNIIILLFLGVITVIGTAIISAKMNPPPEGQRRVIPLSTHDVVVPPPTSQKEVAINPTPSPASEKTEPSVQGSFLGSVQKHTLPLGDKRYVTDKAKKGYVYLCNARSDEQGGGAGVDGPWITGSTWNPNQKISVSGSVSWPNASMSVAVANGMRTFTTNDLPKTHTTGVYPVSASDPAYAYDRNPNTIKAQSLSLSVTVSPTTLSSPACIGGEVGLMTSGAVLFNAFDAQLRDAVAHELQDSCDGHPQVSGMYHYHGPSSCFKDTDLTSVIGYAFDGFPITGSKVGEGTYLFTDDLDECHGLTSEIILDGKKTKTYHYVMTQDFPYSVSCFRGKSQVNGPLGGVMAQNPNTGGGQSGQTGQGMPQQGGTPPQEAINACSGKPDNSSCSFSTPNGTKSGVCHIPPGQSSLACVPQ